MRYLVDVEAVDPQAVHTCLLLSGRELRMRYEADPDRGADSRTYTNYEYLEDSPAPY